MGGKAEQGVFLVDEQGTEVFVPQSQVHEAVASGLSVVPGQSITFTSPSTGSTSTVSGEDFVAISDQSRSSTIADPDSVREEEDARREREHYSGAGNQALAFGAGVARGASAGLSDVALTGLGIADKRDLRGLRAAHSKTSTIGEIGGAVVPGMLSGGGSLAARAASKTIAGQATKLGVKTTAKLGGTIKAAAAGGMAEGAIFGAGQGLSNVALSDEPLTAEAVFAEVGMGAVVGGALGAAGGAAGQALSKVGNKVDDIDLGINPSLDLASTEGKLLQRSVIDAATEIDDVAKSVMVNADNAAAAGSKEVFDPSVAKNYDNAISRHFDEVEKHIDNIEAGSYPKFQKPEPTAADFKATGAVSPKAKASKVGPSKAEVSAAKKEVERLANELDADTGFLSDRPMFDKLRAERKVAIAKLDDLEAKSAAAAKAKIKNADVPAKKAPATGESMASARELLVQARKSGDEFRSFLSGKVGTTKSGATKWDDAVSLTGKDLDEAKKLFAKYQDDTRRMADEAAINPLDEDKLGNVLPGERGLFDILADVPVTRQVARGALAGADDAAKAVRAAEGRLRASLGLKSDEAMDISKVFAQEPAEAIASLKAFDEYSQGLKSAAELVDGPATSAATRIQDATDKMAREITEAIGKDGQLPELAQMALLFGVEETMLPELPGPADDLLKLYFAYKAVKMFGGRGATQATQATKAATGGVLGKRGVRGFVKEGVQGIVGRGMTKDIFSPTGRLQNALGRQVSGSAFDFVVGGNSKMASATGNSLKRLQDGMARSLRGAGKAAKRSSPITTRVLADISFAGEADRKKNRKMDAHAAFKARSEELNRSMANLPAFQRQVHDNLAGIRQANLGVGDKMAAHTVAVAQFLHSQMPKDPGTLQQFGVSKWRPTEAQMDKWARTINAAQDPAGIIERFGNGHMSREDATVLRTLYPAHFAKVQEWVMENLPEMQKKMSYERRIQISSLMGVAADPTVSRVDVWQNSFTQEQQQKPITQMQTESTSQPTAAQQMSGTRE